MHKYILHLKTLAPLFWCKKVTFCKCCKKNAPPSPSTARKMKKSQKAVAWIDTSSHPSPCCKGHTQPCYKIKVRPRWWCAPSRPCPCVPVEGVFVGALVFGLVDHGRIFISYWRIQSLNHILMRVYSSDCIFHYYTFQLREVRKSASKITEV
jgi:hypothetical protein